MSATYNNVKYKVEDLFSLRRTDIGYCCLFNYNRTAALRFQGERSTRIPTPVAVGDKQGLSVLLNASTADYYYTIRNTNGFVTLIFNADEYPEASTGNYQAAIISAGTLNYLDLKTIRQIADRDLKSFSPRKRRCYFRDDIPEFKGNYTYSECLVLCKLYHIAVLCRCFPATYPRNLTNFANNSTKQCSMYHYSCMHRYKCKCGGLSSLIFGIFKNFRVKLP